MALRKSAVPVTAVYRVSQLVMARVAASNTAWGGGKSGSPTQRDVTSMPSACICLTLENIWTVADTLTPLTSGLTSIALSADDDDDDENFDAGFDVVECWWKMKPWELCAR